MLRKATGRRRTKTDSTVRTYTARYTKIDRGYMGQLVEWPEVITEEAALARLDAELQRSVDLHQRSDVPYGMFLSGGTDSAAVLAMMARLNDRPVLAFTAGFDVPGAADASVEQVTGQPVLEVDVDRQALARHGVRAGDAMRLVAALAPVPVGDIYQGERRVPLDDIPRAQR